MIAEHGELCLSVNRLSTVGPQISSKEDNAISAFPWIGSPLGYMSDMEICTSSTWSKDNFIESKDKAIGSYIRGTSVSFKAISLTLWTISVISRVAPMQSFAFWSLQWAPSFRYLVVTRSTTDILHLEKEESGAPNVNFRKISVLKTIWDLEFSEHLL